MHRPHSLSIHLYPRHWPLFDSWYHRQAADLMSWAETLITLVYYCDRNTAKLGMFTTWPGRHTHGDLLTKDHKGKHPESGGVRREITCWHQAEESEAKGGGFRRLMPASDLLTRTTRWAGVFLLFRTYLWNKQQLMSINLTMWSTHHAVPRGGGSRSFLRDALSSTV